MDIAVYGNLAERTGKPLNFARILSDAEARLTTEHAASSHGQPVLVYDDRAYGPGDLHGLVLTASAKLAGAEEVRAARAAGWDINVVRFCDWCGEPLPDPEDRRVTLHPECREAY